MPIVIRPLDPESPGEIALVARRMRSTLVEVLGRERGRRMYTLAWLKRRVLFHLDPERPASGRAFGLFSTTYVVPSWRRRRVAERLLRRGERWMRLRGLSRAATYTSAANAKLIRLYEKRGYAIAARYPRRNMVELSKRLTGVRRGRASGARASSA